MGDGILKKRLLWFNQSAIHT